MLRLLPQFSGVLFPTAGAALALRINDAMPLFFVRYKQKHEMLFPFQEKPSITWFLAEDTWTKKNGE